METGKRICQALKNLRKRIADVNEIPFEIEECVLPQEKLTRRVNKICGNLQVRNEISITKK